MPTAGLRIYEVFYKRALFPKNVGLPFQRNMIPVKLDREACVHTIPQSGIERISSDEGYGEPIKCQDCEIGYEVRDRMRTGPCYDCFLKVRKL